MNLRHFQTVKARRTSLEKATGADLSHIGSFTLDEAVASSRHCENMVGAVQIPMGIAGPIKISNLNSQISDVYIPLATTEGALVASVNRGCKAIGESGGATVDSYRAGATRGPVFKVANIQESDRLNKFLVAHFTDLQKIAKETSRHITLTKYMDRGVGRYRYVRFVFDTQDAMGMNMVTIATQAIVGFIEKHTGIACLSVAGNFDVDKKPSWLNMIEGRGWKVWAEVTIPQSVLKNTLKTTARAMFDVWIAKCMIGSAIAGSMGFNAHYANIVAALFLATGQDPGHVVEGSLGITTCEMVSSPSRASGASRGVHADLYISVYLPDVMVGTVGGGTGLATQKEALSILGVRRSNDLAEATGAAVLAGEISLLASLSEGTLSRAHERLGRGEKKQINK